MTWDQVVTLLILPGLVALVLGVGDLPLQAPAPEAEAGRAGGAGVVTTKSSRRPNLEEKAAAEVPRAPVSREEGAAAQPSTPIVTAKSSRCPPVEGKGKAAQPSTLREAERVPAPPPANDDRKPAIVTARRRGKRIPDVPEMTPEEDRRRGEAADAMWREPVRRATAKDRL